MTAKKIPTHTQQNTKPTKTRTEKEALDLLKVLPVEGDQDQTTVKAKKPRKKLKPLDLGRPPTLTPKLVDQICDKIQSSGAYPVIVAQSLGVPLDTFEKRMREDLDFQRRIEGARAEAEVGMTTRIHGAPTWHGAAWMLERTRPERYAPKSYMAIDARAAAGMGDEELQRIVLGIVQSRGLAEEANSETGQDEPVEMVNGPDGEYQAKD
ncbi:hypothetical protein LCGC14_3081610 [marine sediment metagenome]|uniref:Uncharacterized protein n=1 Tax=marine sediment metagenome TaxID=412755 RepID=A0A0F8X1N8_9ZZZZ